MLKWKLKPGEVITYKTTMDEMDTANYKTTTMNFGGMAKLISKMLADSSGKMDKEKEKEMKEFDRKMQNIQLMSKLTEAKSGIIDIVGSYIEKKTEEDTTHDSLSDALKDEMKFMESMVGNVALRGSVDENGKVQSFYVKNDQRNLIAIFYELPGKPVKVGDTWSLDIHFISMDQNFKCDTSYRKNEVKLTGIKKQGKETIAELKYDIDEYVSGDFKSPMNFGGMDKQEKTTMKITYTGTAEFSIEQGRWLNFDGIMFLDASGVMTSHTAKKCSLILELERLIFTPPLSSRLRQTRLL